VRAAALLQPTRFARQERRYADALRLRDELSDSGHVAFHGMPADLLARRAVLEEGENRAVVARRE
jgi:hypothetical protein